MRLLALALVASALLSTACVSSRPVIPSATVPHQLSRPVQRATIWAKGSDGKMHEVPVYIPEGWWIAGPPVVEEEPTP